jgi:proteasome assembly chaperone (PAC2) family protein
MMKDIGILMTDEPKLHRPLLIAGFDGWGNAMDVSSEMAEFLIRHFDARPFARFKPDLYYRYDASRPVVRVEDGVLEALTLPGATFYCTRTTSADSDLIILKADEPVLMWEHFAESLFELVHALGVRVVVTMGSMFDNVLPSDRILSAIASDAQFDATLRDIGVLPVSYSGPSAIHSIVHQKAVSEQIPSMSLWCHCPYYLQGTTHYGLLAQLAKVLAAIGRFTLPTEQLESRWMQLSEQIQQLIDDSPELQKMIGELRKAKVRGTRASMKTAAAGAPNVIDIRDFLQPK